MKIRNRSARFGLMLSAASLAAVASYAAAPPAGEKIGNQASATYVNAAGDTISVTSNKVETIVQQVAGLTLATDNTEDAAPGGKVFLPHVLTNDGNGPDVFDLTAADSNPAGGGFDFTNVTIYPDADFDGVADGTTPITVTPALAAGQSFGIVIEATIPSAAALASSETIDVTATSQFAPGPLPGTPLVTASNTDTVTVTDGPVTEIVKSMTVVDTVADGKTGPGDTVTVTLTYSSTGISAAQELTVTDQLDAFLIYSGNSGSWSDSATAMGDGTPGMDDATNGLGQSIDYSYDGTDTVEFVIDTVPSGRSGSVTFEATIAPGAPAGVIPNIATQTVEIGGVPTDYPPSNPAQVIVDDVYAVSAADAIAVNWVDEATGDSATNLAGGASSTDDDGALNDVVDEQTDVSQGGTVAMEFVITNHSNLDDTIDVSWANDAAGGFPAGTTFQIVGSDGATPVVGALGPLPTGASTTVSVIATLPANVTPSVAAEDFSGTLTAQSTNGGEANTVTGQFTGLILAAAVDLENSDASGDGADDGVSKLTQPTDPAVPASFPMVVQNGGPTSDTYDLTLDTPLPTGWTVEIQLPDGTPITNTGVIPGGGSQDVIVIVTPPAGTPPGDVPFTIGVTSPTSGQGDTLVNTVSVNEIIDLAISSDQLVQAAPGGISDIPHTLTNEGNVAITEGAITSAGTFNTFAGTVFHDVNGNGQVDPGEPVVDNIDDIVGGIAAGADVSLIHRVQVPSVGAVGLSEVETITVGSALNSGAVTDSDLTDNAVEDTVVIVSGDMTLVKMQAVDPACNGNPGVFVQANINAEPGQCIRYSITAENTGTADATAVTIKDSVPGYTTFTDCGGLCDASPATASTPADGATGAVESVTPTVISGGSATLEFTVKIDQ